MPVPIIRISDHLKSGQKCPVTSIDRFIKKRVTNKIFFMPKWSRLAEKKSGPDFEWLKQDGRHHSKTGLFSPDFEWSTSLDRFIKKRVMNKLFFIPKRSSLAGKKAGLNFEWIRKSNTNCVRKDTIRKPDGSVFGGVLYIF
jgi:hypothetical protein